LLDLLSPRRRILRREIRCRSHEISATIPDISSASKGPARQPTDLLVAEVVRLLKAFARGLTASLDLSGELNRRRLVEWRSRSDIDALRADFARVAEDYRNAVQHLASSSELRQQIAAVQAEALKVQNEVSQQFAELLRSDVLARYEEELRRQLEDQNSDHLEAVKHAARAHHEQIVRSLAGYRRSSEALIAIREQRACLDALEHRDIDPKRSPGDDDDA
jgi:hypothetical protein